MAPSSQQSDDQHPREQNELLDAAIDALDEVVVLASAHFVELPHSVVVTDAETGTSTAYGPYPDAHQALLAVDAVLVRDSSAAPSVVLARNAEPQ